MDKNITSEYLRTVSVIHFALMGGIIMFSAVVYFILLEPEQGIVDQEFYDIARFLVPVFAIGGYFSGDIVSKQVIAKSKDKDWESRLKTYQTALIIKDAALEGPALLAIVSALLTNKIEFLFIVIAILFIMFMIRPTAENIRKALRD